MAPSPNSPNNDKPNTIINVSSNEKLNQLQNNLFSAIRHNELEEVRKIIGNINSEYGERAPEILNNFKTTDGKSLIQETLNQRFGFNKYELSQNSYDSFHLPNIMILETLINNKIDLNKENNNTSPLILAVNLKDKDLVDLFIKNGSNVNAKDQEGKTPLHHTLQQVNLLEPREIQEVNLIATSLLKSDAQVNAQDLQGQTPYHYATQANLTINRENNINVWNSDRGTYIDKAKQDAVTATIDILQKYNANPNIVDKSGQSVNDMIVNNAKLQASELEANLETRQLLITKISNPSFTSSQSLGNRIKNFFQQIVDFLKKPFTFSDNLDALDISKETISTIINPKKIPEVTSPNVENPKHQENKQLLGEVLKGLNNHTSSFKNLETNNIPQGASPTLKANKTEGKSQAQR